MARTFTVEQGTNSEDVEADYFKEEGSMIVFYRKTPDPYTPEEQVAAFPKTYVSAVREKK